MGSIRSLENATIGIKTRATIDFLKGPPKKLLIGGKWISAKSGKTFETVNPANEEVLAMIAEGDKADVDEAVKAARKALDDGRWSSISPHLRSRYLFKIADLIEENAEQLAELESLENGKPLTNAEVADIPGAARTFRYYAGWCTKIFWGDQPLRSLDVQLHPTRTSRSVWTDNSVEFSALDGFMEARPGSRLRQYRRA